MSEQDAVADESGSFGLYKATCQWCRFYHHGDSTCIRHAPTPTYYRIEAIAEEIMLAFGMEYDFSSTTNWPSVSPKDACGEFDRGSGLGKMAIHQQKAMWPDEFSGTLADATSKPLLEES